MQAQQLEQLWKSPPEASRPWVFWYWMQGAVSKFGITADLEAMKEVGIAGAYLMPIKGVPEEPFVEPVVEQLSPLWWEMVEFAFREADRVGVKLGFHVCDGFALAGGPWITPERSMQKVVWSRAMVQGGGEVCVQLPRPEAYQGYYEDIAVFAYPSLVGEKADDSHFPERKKTDERVGEGDSDGKVPPSGRTEGGLAIRRPMARGYEDSTLRAEGGADDSHFPERKKTDGAIPSSGPEGPIFVTAGQRPADSPPADSPPEVEAQFLLNEEAGETFRSDQPCWILFSYQKPFTCRSISLRPAMRNLQAQRLIVETSDDGIHFSRHTRLEPPRQGWQNDEFASTYSIPPVTARYFRFVYEPDGMEPGAEDLDAAKWKQGLRIRSLRPLSEARIHHFEGKNGSIWRVSPRTPAEQLPPEVCIDRERMIDVSAFVDSSGRLRWDAPAGEWTILRMGHTSNGLRNATGGAGSGLECDKFDAEVVRLQFNSWFGKAVEVAGEELASRVLKLFHVDSWECSSQNWSPVFREEFRRRRGYDLYGFLPVMAGIPVDDAETSERVLHDVRQTIADLVVDVFYKTLQEEAHAKGCEFGAESVAPTMLSDGMLHYKNTDIPIGEFWVESPTHDKPNDVLDAISGAHIYGKNVVQAEAFTTLRSTFTEHPGMLKALQDRNYALGINRLIYHVCVLNPWPDRRPGMTLDGIGLYFQRDQTWWKQGRAWVDYARRCQALLQLGRPVVDLAVFTGDELPRRALTPDRIAPFVPGLFGAAKMEKERIRMANEGVPTQEMPVGVFHSAHVFKAEDWINPLRGYAYDSFNPDALAMATVVDGALTLPSGMTYQALLIPGKHPMQPNPEATTQATLARLAQLEQEGATVLRPPYLPETLPIDRDFLVTEGTTEYAPNVAYAHRRAADIDVYFISNQENRRRELMISLRGMGKEPELWNPVNGDIRRADVWRMEGGRTMLPLRLEACESVFVVLQRRVAETVSAGAGNYFDYAAVAVVASPWLVQFDPKFGGPEGAVAFPALEEWNRHDNEAIRYYSGTAVYTTELDWTGEIGDKPLFLALDSVYNIASVRINGIDCGTIWTKPYRLPISHALRQGKNTLQIEVTNTWANRLMGNEEFGAGDTPNIATWTNARYRVGEKKLVPAGLSGGVRVELEIKN
jgi:hypothetical protein